MTVRLTTGALFTLRPAGGLADGREAACVLRAAPMTPSTRTPLISATSDADAIRSVDLVALPRDPERLPTETWSGAQPEAA
jgi:hypothetical protein